MAMIETWLRTDLKKPVAVEQLTGKLFSGDNQGNLVGVEIMDGGQPATISGNVMGYIIRADDATVVVEGTLTNNKAYIVLPQSAYIVVGRVSIVIKVGTCTVGACTVHVYQSTTDTLVDPGHVIPSLEELLEKIADCEAATTAANTAAGSANSAASTANTAATAANTAASTANTAAGKIDNMTVDAENVVPGGSASATVSEVSGHKHIHFGIPRGQPGRDGVIAQIDLGLFSMNINSDGDLICTYSNTPPTLSINSNGDLIYTV